MFRLFPKFDPRLKADLLKQKRPIVVALVCVAITSVLTVGTAGLIEGAVRAINNATPIAVDIDRLNQKSSERRTQLIAEKLNVDEKDLARATIAADAEISGARESKGKVTARQKKALSDLGLYCFLVVAVFALKYWFTRGSAYYIAKASTLLANELRERIFDRLQRLPIAYFNKRRAGAIQSVLTNDVNVYLNAVMVVRDSIDGPIKLVLGLVAVFFIQWKLALIALFFVPLLAGFVQYNGRKTKQASAEVQADLANLQAFTQESLQGTRVIRAFAAEGRIRDAFQRLIGRYYGSQMKLNRRVATLKPLVEFIGAACLACVIYACGWLALGAELTISQVTSLVYILDVVNQGFRSMGYVSNTFKLVEAASERIYGEVLDVPTETEQDEARSELPHLQGQIEFRNVSFTYPDGTPALSNVSFVIEPGTSLALVGPSGAGKSTIADLLLRFYDASEGQVLIDGVDVRELKTRWTRNQIGVVPQQTFLFAGTIADNLRMGAPDATEDQMRRAVKAAHAENFVDRTPAKLEEELGESGMGLSGGERQRLAIARALVRDPKILVLDEATSNLDAESERAVTEALDEIMHTRTTLFIAHRLTTAARADKIAMLRKGEVLEIGSHRELLEANGPYAAMYRMFSSGLLDEGVPE